MSRISSLRARLLVGIMVPSLTLIALDGISVYSTALEASNTAYDRTLLASAKVIGEQLDVEGYDAQAHLRATGIETLVHYPVAITRQPAFRSAEPADCPVAEAAANEVLSLPLYPALPMDDIERVAGAICAFAGTHGGKELAS